MGMNVTCDKCGTLCTHDYRLVQSEIRGVIQSVFCWILCLKCFDKLVKWIDEK